MVFDSSGDLYVANPGGTTVNKFAMVPTPTAGGVVIHSSIPTRPMSIGGGASDVAGINLTDAELAQIETTAAGTVTIGDSTQTGNITVKTATVATTPGASTVVVQATGGSGEITLDDQGSAAALDGNGGTVSLTAGTDGIAAASVNNTFSEIATTGNVTLDTTGPDRHRRQPHSVRRYRHARPHHHRVGRAADRAPISTGWAT